MSGGGRIGAFALMICMLGLPVSAGDTEGRAVVYGNFNYIHDVASSQSSVYFATSDGIIRYDKLRKAWMEPLSVADAFDHADVRQIWVDQFDQKLTISCQFGMWEYDMLFERWFPISAAPPEPAYGRHIAPPPMMFGPPGINYYQSGRIEDSDGRSYRITDILDDESGNLWVATWGYGAAQAGSASHFMELLPYGLLQRRVNAIYDDGTNLWLGGAVLNAFRTGLSIFNVDSNSFRYVESGLQSDLPVVDVNCLAGDSANVYIGTPEGLFEFDQATMRVARRLSSRSGLSNENVLAIHIIGDTLLLGTADGLNLVYGDADTVELVRPDQFAGLIVYDFEAVDSTIWIATSDGAYRLSLRSGKLARFIDPEMMVFGNVYAVEAYEDNLWFATRSGLVRLEISSGRTEAYQLASALGDVRSLAVNDRVAAISSDNGVSLLPFRQKRMRIREITTDDGLVSSYVFSLYLDGDYLWIGSDRGLTRFFWNDPDLIE